MKIIIALLFSITSASAAELRIPPLHKPPVPPVASPSFLDRFYAIGKTPLPADKLSPTAEPLSKPAGMP